MSLRSTSSIPVLITSLTTLLAVSAIYVFATGPVQLFALNMIIGVVIGTYSSIFVASPVLMGWQGATRKRKARKDAERHGAPAAVRSADKPKESAAAPVAVTAADKQRSRSRKSHGKPERKSTRQNGNDGFAPLMKKKTKE